MDNFGTLYREGIRIAMRTNTGRPATFRGYFEHMELRMMVDAGLSLHEAI